MCEMEKSGSNLTTTVLDWRDNISSDRSFEGL